MKPITPHLRWRLRELLMLGVAASSLVPAVAARSAPLAQGVVWQIDNAHTEAQGDWNRLGVRDLLVQWTAVDDTAFVATSAMPLAPRLPDWAAIGRQPWARNVIVGLAGRFDENSARRRVALLIEQSVGLARLRLPVHVVGWYFPVEVDPSWQDAKTLGPMLARLPRPLWISVYDRTNIGGRALAEWLDSWLPKDVGVFLQDGCGVYAREAVTARGYADALSARLGARRVRIIAEAFRPQTGGGFRSATAAELGAQLAHYHGYRTYLFDGPHYVSNALVQALLDRSREPTGTSHFDHP